MIISSNSGPFDVEFKLLLGATLNELNIQAKDIPKKMSELNGKKLESHVMELLEERAIGTPFQGTIELISGQSFPDIVANKYYGVEVKTTIQNHWTTTGNSVLETTRRVGVERIFMLFGKLAKPIEFRCKPYEACLSEVVVTHSPRYLIDMELDKGETIFDKIKKPYDVLRKEDNPIKTIINYYKSKLEEGDEVWWIDQENNRPSNIIIKIWSSLDIEEKRLLRGRAMAFFPDLFSSKIDKYGKLAMWLLTKEGIVCPNLRDEFSAGGQKTFTLNNKSYTRISKVYWNLHKNIKIITRTIAETQAEELSGFWGQKTSNKTKLLDWVKLVSESAKEPRLDIKEFIKNSIKEAGISA
jgi:hypothetical protein